METLFKEDESCVEMIMSNTALGAIGGSLTGFVKAAYYMGPKIPVVPISKHTLWLLIDITNV